MRKALEQATIMYGVSRSQVTPDQLRVASSYLWGITRDMEVTIGGILPVGTKIVCWNTHPHGSMRLGGVYRINGYRYRTSSAKGKEFVGVRIRGENRKRTDFNFKIGSPNYFWHYFILHEVDEVIPYGN